MSVPGLVDLADPAQVPGGCEFGRQLCVQSAELVVEVAATGLSRQLCRVHAGPAMLAAAASDRVTRVLIRRLG